MKLWWYSAANILYALSSLGYLAINIVNLIDRNTIDSSVTYIILIILAVLLFLMLYFTQQIGSNNVQEKNDEN
jgi:hypothetical protein